MPQMICNMCRWNLDRSYKFKQQCKKADEALRNYPISGVLPRPFPPISAELPESLKRSNDQRIQNQDNKKPRLDNGDRERREAREREQERSTNERKSDHRHEFYEEGEEVEEEQELKSANKEDRKLEPGEIRVHACDQCDRTFPLRQALVLHIQRAHRDRNYKCTECDRMFFSKYDLQKHMATHSEEKPYSCSICNKQFIRANLLQRHEKVHRDELRYGCTHCDREFFTTEELEKHEETAHKTAKQYECNICKKRFTYKQGLERHEMLHNEDKSFVCEYCKEAFRTSTKLARHLTTHAGHRPYLCKLCPRTFLLSHHLTRHMRTHSVEKRHVCEDCGKAFKRKESLDVHQLTHTKRTGPGLTCDVCQESCRNRADYVTHIKQHIEAGEKMGPDGLPPENKEKTELDSEEEDEDDDQYSDDDYEPPAYVVKKLPKPIKRSASDDELEKEKEDEAKEQVVFMRGKDGNLIKKTIKTLMPIQRKDAAEIKGKSMSPPQVKGKEDETEAQVQKIVASVFKEHKIPLKNQPEGKEPGKVQTLTKDEKAEGSGVVKAVKVIKRIVVRKPGAENQTKEPETVTSPTPASSGTAQKVTKRVIVRRIIRQGDTTREIIMNPDGTIIDPSELANIPTRNVVKRVVVKRPLNKDQMSGLIQSASEQIKTGDNSEYKFELKVSQPSTSQKPKESESISQSDKETKEKLELLEKRVEQQRLKIEELQARNQQDYEPVDEMMPERHDDSEDEQQLPLKRVFVKRKQSVYDEVQEYNDPEKEEEEVVKQQEEPVKEEQIAVEEVTKKDPKVYSNKKTSKVEEPAQDVEDMSQELCNILDSTDTVVKMQENVLNNLTQIGIGYEEAAKEGEIVEEMAVQPGEKREEKLEEKVEEATEKERPETMEVDGQEMTGAAADIFEGESKEQGVIEPDAEMNSSKTMQLSEVNDSRDSIEDKLSQMEG